MPRRLYARFDTRRQRCLFRIFTQPAVKFAKSVFNTSICNASILIINRKDAAQWQACNCSFDDPYNIDIKACM